MAQFDANINLDVNSNRALRKIEQVEKAVNKLNSATDKVRVQVEGARQAEQEVARLYKALERLENAALSQLPRSVQVLIAYLKAANSGMAELASRAALAAAGVGEISRVSFAPLIRQLNQAKSLMFEIQQVSVKFLDAPTNFRPRLPGPNPAQKLLDGLDYVKVSVDQPFQKLLDGLNRVKVRVIETERVLKGLGNTIKRIGGAGFGGPGGQGPGGPGGPGGVGGAGGALPPNNQNLIDNATTLRGLRNIQAELIDLRDTATIGTRAFRLYEDQIEQVNNRIRDAQLLGQRGGSGINNTPFGPEPSNRVVPGSIRALQAELAAKQALVNNAKVGTQAFNKYSRELSKTTKELERAQSGSRGFFKTLTNPNSRLGSSVIGAGFPLITGGGVGSVLGGGVGGALGGFAGSIGGSAIGQAFDQAVASLIKTAEVTGSVGEAFDFLTEKQLFSSDKTRRLAEELAELGRVEELAQVVTQELVDKIGNDGVQNLKDLDSEFSDLLSGITELGLAIAGFLSQYLTPLIKTLNNAVDSINTRNRFEALRQDIAGTDREEAFNAAVAERRRENRKNTRGGQGRLSTADQQALLKQFPAIVEAESLIEVTDPDRDRFSPKAAKETKLAASRLLELEQQITREKLKQESIEAKIVGITEGKGAAAQFELDNLEKRFEQEAKIIELQRQNALSNNKVAEDVAKINELHDERIDTLTKEQELKRIELERLQARVQLERELAVLADERAKAQSLAALDTNIERLNLDLANPFGGFEYEQQKLQLQQAAEATALLTQEQNKLSDIIRERDNAIIGSTEFDDANAAIERQKQYIVDLNTRIAKENEVEMAILRQRQILQTLQPITDGIASGFADMITSLIDGTKSVEEAFANMLKNIGDALIQEGTRMIAQYIAIGIARAFAMGSSPSLPGGGGFGQNSPQLFTGGNIFDAPFKRFEGGGYTGNAPRSGGLDGRGGFMAMMHPQETVIDHRSAMNRYPSGGNQIPTFNLETTVINGVEYATVDQVRAMGKQAAREGASGGHARSMTTLKNSRSQRSKLGMR